MNAGSPAAGAPPGLTQRRSRQPRTGEPVPRERGSSRPRCRTGRSRRRTRRTSGLEEPEGGFLLPTLRPGQPGAEHEAHQMRRPWIGVLLRCRSNGPALSRARRLVQIPRQHGCCPTNVACRLVTHDMRIVGQRAGLPPARRRCHTAPRSSRVSSVTIPKVMNSADGAPEEPLHDRCPQASRCPGGKGTAGHERRSRSSRSRSA